MHIVSNLGVQGEFTVDAPPSNNPSNQKKSEIKPVSTAKEEQL